MRASAQGGIDVIALDQHMPGLDGLETLARIRAIDNAPPVVFVTASLDSRIAVTALKAGAADYLVKDTQGEFIPLLAVAVAGALNGARMRQAKEAAEAEVRAARDRYAALAAEREVLLREVNHRVGNSLQIIASLLHLQASSSDDDGVKAALTNAMGRVAAVAQVHRRLYTSHDLQARDARPVSRGAAGGPAPLGRRREADPADAARPSRSRSIRTAPWRSASSSTSWSSTPSNTPIPTAPGRSTWSRAAAARLINLSVADQGVGLADEPAPGSTGMGRRIVDAMAAKLEARIKLDQRRRPAHGWPRACPTAPQAEGAGGRAAGLDFFAQSRSGACGAPALL